MDAFTTYTVWNLCYSFSPSSGRSNFWLFCSSLLCSVCWLLPDYNTIAHCQFWWFFPRFNKSFIWSPWNLTLNSNLVFDFGEVDLCENQTYLFKFNIKNSSMFSFETWFLIFFGHEEKCFCTYFCQKMCVETKFLFDNILILGSNLGWF